MSTPLRTLLNSSLRWTTVRISLNNADGETRKEMEEGGTDEKGIWGPDVVWRAHSQASVARRAELGT
jgi:hypothetical protein